MGKKSQTATSLDGIEKFFLREKTSQNLSDSEKTRLKIARRLYGVQEVEVGVLEGLNAIENPELRHEEITKILHSTQHLAHILAYRSHNGGNWRRDSAVKMKNALMQQFNGGRAAEMIMTEALMLQDLEGYHFLPVKEIDLSHKVDMISRVGVKRNGRFERTLAFGTQLTTAPIEGISGRDNIYERKREIVAAHLWVFENEYSHLDLVARYGALTVPDIISFVALNGYIGKAFGNGKNLTETKFFEWKRDNFELTKGLLGRFKHGLREDILLLAHEISQAQKMIVSEEFLEKFWEDFETEEQFYAIYKRHISYSSQTWELVLTIQKEDEILMKAHFFTTPKVREWLQNPPKRDKNYREKLKNFHKNI